MRHSPLEKHQEFHRTLCRGLEEQPRFYLARSPFLNAQIAELMVDLPLAHQKEFALAEKP
ncbi:MAG: hypothetical protein LH647_20115 [Leptolyngbyaceae cyanobacterium CAN_BIN12]|nr:hypothetical protein [Leptolyngbyaceae cyanobacterium CAN_BIN12]